MNPPNLTSTVVDEERGVKYWQYINSCGTHMTKVVGLKSGWSVESNHYQVGNLPEDALEELCGFLRQSENKSGTTSAERET